MNSQSVSTHVFLYYETSGKYLLSSLAQFYKGPIFLSLVENNPANHTLLNYAEKLFKDINITYVTNAGTDQYGFYHSFKKDTHQKPWTFYCHDKSPDKKHWLSELLEIYHKYDESYLSKEKIGIIASEKHKIKIVTLQENLQNAASMPIEHRKKIVESMHTIIWLYELARILAQKYNYDNKALTDLTFSAGNIFLIRTSILQVAHSCILEEFFNKNVYRSDGEVEHGMERFYFYVSKTMGYDNLFI